MRPLLFGDCKAQAGACGERKAKSGSSQKKAAGTACGRWIPARLAAEGDGFPLYFASPNYKILGNMHLAKAVTRTGKKTCPEAMLLPPGFLPFSGVGGLLPELFSWFCLHLMGCCGNRGAGGQSEPCRECSCAIK